MLAKVHAFVLQGIDALACEVEIDLVPLQGLQEPVKPTIVGLPDTAVKESVSVSPSPSSCSRWWATSSPGSIAGGPRSFPSLCVPRRASEASAELFSMPLSAECCGGMPSQSA